MSNGFCGGVGSTHEELCGAISAGVMVIGLKHGRTQSSEDDKECLLAIGAFRQRFIENFGATKCDDLRGRAENCGWLVEDSSRILLDVMDEEWTVDTSATDGQ